MRNKRKSISLLGWIIGALLLIYLGVFCYLNLCKYAQHVDSDIAAEALLAREIWVEKDITPNDWISSTERRIIGMPTVAAVFYGITGSMQTAAGITCVLLGAILLGTFYFFLRKLSLSRPASITALLVLCALPINGFRNEGQMVPFVTLLLFLFAEYYVFHGIFLFFNILFYLKLKENRQMTRKTFLEWLVLFVAAVLLNCGGQRCLQVIILPLLVVEVIALFMESGHLRQKLPGGRYLATAYVGSLVLAFLVSCLYGGRGDYAVYLLQPGEAVEKLLLGVPAALLENFGLVGNAKVGSFASLMQLLVWVFLILLGYGLWYVFRKNTESTDRQKDALTILLASVGVTAFIIGITSAEAAHYYFFMAWFAAAVLVAVMVDHMSEGQPVFAGLILTAVALFAVLNLKYTYCEAATTQDNLKEYQEVADYLTEAGIDYGYAEFWDAERICLITDGRVTMGHSYTMASLSGYWWLTSMKWYPPTLPKEMRTAYVVRTEMREAFEQQFPEGEAPILEYENEKLAVYVGNINGKNIPYSVGNISCLSDSHSFGPELLVLSVFLLRNGGLQHQKSPDKRQYLETFCYFPADICPCL